MSEPTERPDGDRPAVSMAQTTRDYLAGRLSWDEYRAIEQRFYAGLYGRISAGDYGEADPLDAGEGCW